MKEGLDLAIQILQDLSDNSNELSEMYYQALEEAICEINKKIQELEL